MNRDSLTLDLNLPPEAELPTEPKGSHKNSTMEKLPALLRMFGAMAVIFSLYSFLFRGWEGSDDLIRYAMLLGHTVLLVVIALFSGKFFQEGKSPRLLMMLSLVSVPVNFSILGAFIFAGVNSVFEVQYPTYVAWSVGSLSTALLLTVAACAALIPVTLLAFKTLVRGMSASMSSLFLAGNLVLLLPVREPLVVFFLTTALAVVTLFISAKTARQRTEVKTFEGMIALLLQFMPVAILLGRNLWLYASDALLLVGVAVTAFIILRQVSMYIRESSTYKAVLEFSSVILALFSGLSLSVFLSESHVHDSLVLLLAGGVAAGMCYEVAQRARVLAGLYRTLAVLIVLFVSIVNLLFISGATASFVALFVGIGCVVMGYQLQQRSVFIGGVLLVVAGLVDQFIHAFHYFDFSYWLGLAIAGIAAIVLASVLESKGKQMKVLANKYRQHYAIWNL